MEEWCDWSILYFFIEKNSTHVATNKNDEISRYDLRGKAIYDWYFKKA